jgi:hypothetical protein
VYSEEDDRKNTFNTMIEHRKEVIKKLREDGHGKHKDQIAKELALIHQM